MAAKILKFKLPRVEVPKPSRPMKTAEDMARVNDKVEVRKAVEEEMEP